MAHRPDCFTSLDPMRRLLPDSIFLRDDNHVLFRIFVKFTLNMETFQARHKHQEVSENDNAHNLLSNEILWHN
jgi:hypothetical protein